MSKHQWLSFTLGCSILLAIFVLASLGSPMAIQAQGASQLRLVQSDTTHLVMELEISGYNARSQTIDGKTYTVLAIDGLEQTGERGKPQLPAKGTLIGIPPGAQATVKILADDTRQETVVSTVIPVPTARIESNLRQAIPNFIRYAYTLDSAAYSANRFYPADVATISTPGNWRSQRYASVSINPLQYNPVTRQVIFHKRVRVEITFTYPRGMNASTLGSLINEGAFEPLMQQTILNYDTAKNWRAKVPASVTSPKGPQQLTNYTGNYWYKIAVNADGIYQVMCSALQAAGLPVASLDPSTLKVYDQGTELAIRVVGSTWNTTCGSGDYIEFFGRKLDTKYTDTNIYWLTFGGTAGKRIAPPAPPSGVGAVPSTFTDTLHFEENHWHFIQPGIPVVNDPVQAEVADRWMWTFAETGTPFTTNFSLNRASSGTFTATLQVLLDGLMLGNHTSQILINGNVIANVPWSGQGEYRGTFSLPQSYLVNGTNTITINALSSGGYDGFFINNFDLSYQSTFTALTDTIRFRQADVGTWAYQVSGFTSSSVQVYDITDSFNVTQFSGPTISTPCPCTLTFTDTIAASREYMAVTTAQRKTPLSIVHDSPSSLHNAGGTINHANYVIISYGGFIGAKLQELANYRASQGMDVQIVNVQDIYDEFSDGSMDAQAIRDFLAYAYNNWNPAPQYVLLVGDGTFDPRGYCVSPNTCVNIVTTANSTFIPAYLRSVDPYVQETASDNCFVAFPDCNPPGGLPVLPSMAIGRLPANSMTDVNNMVDKILNYEKYPATGSWRSTVAFVTDNYFVGTTISDTDKAGDFWDYSNRVASDPQFMPNGLIADRIYYSPHCPSGYALPCPNPAYLNVPTTQNAIVSAINNGRLIVNYVGHGGITVWANEYLFASDTHLDSLALLNNANKLSMFLDMDCLDGYFQYPGIPSLAEESVRVTGKGAIASWAASGLGLLEGHDWIDKGFFRAVTQQKIPQVGMATMQGKAYLAANSPGGLHWDLINTFNLFGDPATRLQIQFSDFFPFIRK